MGVHEAGRMLQALVGVVGVVSLLAMPSSPKLVLLESDRLDRCGDVVQLAALAESAYSVNMQESEQNKGGGFLL